MRETHYLIIGGGIVSLTLAKELIKQGAENITILEKEATLGCHASGRNSGVLHAGIYYAPHTLKAKLCLKGNLLLQEYCRTNQLPVHKTGKVIVVRDESQLPTLHRLHDYATQNGAEVTLIDEKRLAEIEPYAKTHRQALYSHYTAVVDNNAILQSLERELIQSNKVHILFNTRFESLANDYVAKTSQGKIRFEQFINCGGAYADKIAHAFNIGKEFYFIPFKGIYRKLARDKNYLVNGNIYPVPPLDNPFFLGVHFTKNYAGDVYVGPTAIPAFGRENYGIFKGIDREAIKIIQQEFSLYCSNADFRQMAFSEMKKYIPRYVFQDAKKLVKELKPEWLTSTPKVGIRPQLIDIKTKKLVSDFLISREQHSLHILNAVSPAFTSSMAMAEHLVREYL